MNEKKSARKKKNKSNSSSSSKTAASITPTTPPPTTTTTTFVSYIPDFTSSSATLGYPQQQPSQQQASEMSPQTLATTVLTTPEPSYGREVLDKSFYYSVPVLDFENDETCRFAFEELISTIMEGRSLWQPSSSLEVQPSYVAPSHVQ